MIQSGGPGRRKRRVGLETQGVRLHPGPLLEKGAEDESQLPGVRTPALRFGDAIIYSTPKVDPCVSATLSGTRTICLVELRREEAAERREGPR